MNRAELQEYYDLVQEEIQFSPQKGQKWILTLEERHTYEHDIVFHAYSEQGECVLLAYEIVDVIALEVKKRQHKLGETLSGNLRILMSTLKADLPPDLASDGHAKDGSQFKLTFAKRDKLMTYEWELPPADPSSAGFKRIQPVLKLIWAVDEWKQGAKAMGWTAAAQKSPKKDRPTDEQAYGSKKKEDWGGKDQLKPGKKGRIDPFGSVW